MERLSRDGFEVRRAALPESLVLALQGAAERILARERKVRMRVPLEAVQRAPFNDPALLALASGARVRDLWLRSAPPGSRAQAIHRDRSLAKRPALVIDVLLTEFAPENGATEIWPGSHLIPDRDDAERARTAERAASHSSVFVTGGPGDVVFRDPRAWHRAGANGTGARRTMLSLDCELV
jgi:ectoine hydroxylase-related dioxygenase (phytanoyl-CoA dioxygenase family)